MKKSISAVLSIALILSMTCYPASASSTCSNSPESQEIYSSRAIAYMNLDQASEEMQAQIIEAREEIIYSQAWVADGLQGYVLNADGDIIEEVPQFSDLFPADWDMPSINNDEEQLSEIYPTNASRQPDDIMYFYNGTLTLSLPPENSNSPAFCTFSTTGWAGYTHYNITRVTTSATSQVDSFGPYTYNVGYTNAATGQSLGWKPKISSNDIFSVSTPSNIRVSVRASMNRSPNSSTTSGDWYVQVYGDMDILNGPDSK